jgi:hypothetical protein
MRKSAKHVGRPRKSFKSSPLKREVCRMKTSKSVRALAKRKGVSRKGTKSQICARLVKRSPLKALHKLRKSTHKKHRSHHKKSTGRKMHHHKK